MIVKMMMIKDVFLLIRILKKSAKISKVSMDMSLLKKNSSDLAQEKSIESKNTKCQNKLRGESIFLIIEECKLNEFFFVIQ